MPDLHNAILRVVDAAGKSLWHALHAATAQGGRLAASDFPPEVSEVSEQSEPLARAFG